MISLHRGHCIHVDCRPDQDLHVKRIHLATCNKIHCDNLYNYLSLKKLKSSCKFHELGIYQSTMHIMGEP